MDVVIDANILFAILIKESTTQEIFFKDFFHFYATEFVFIEIDKYHQEILRKTSRKEEDFLKLLETLRKRITLVPLEELTPHVSRAELISPDPGDMVYFALALKLNCAIWSNDKQLKKQKEVKVYSTEEILKILASS